MKNKPRYICIESECNKKVWHKNSRCTPHAEKYKKYPCRKKENNPFFNHNQYKITKSFLIEEYCKNQKSERTIAKIKKCSYGTIRHWLYKYNIPLRKRNETKSKIYKGKGNPRYLDGRSFEKYPSEFNASLKLKIRKRDNFTCQLCGISEKEHIEKFRRVLEVHHKDHNRKNCKESNLMTLCKQCNLRV